MTRLSTYSETLERLSKGLIVRTLDRTHWNVTHAATRLGITRTYLYRLMRKHGIARP